MDVRLIRSRMVLMGLNQSEVAKKAGMNPATLSQKLNGKFEFTRPEMEALSEILEADVKELFFAHANSKTKYD